MLNKTDICRELSASTGLGTNAVKHVLDDLAELAGEELADGNDFTIPGIGKISFIYNAPQAKGSRFSKGQEVTNPFTGEAHVAEKDSPAKKAGIRMKLSPLGVVRQFKPGSKPEAQAAYLKSKAGKAVVRRASK